MSWVVLELAVPGRQTGVTNYYGVVRAIFGTTTDARIWLDAYDRSRQRHTKKRPMQVKEWTAGATMPGDVLSWDGIPPEASDSIPPTSWEVIVKGDQG